MKFQVYVLSALLFISCVSGGGSSSQQEHDVSDLDTNSDLKEALKFGINWIYQQAADKYGISDANIEVTKVNSINSWEENNNNYYSFDVESTNNNDASINGAYTVRCDAGGEKKVTKWKYHIEWNDNGNDEECNVDANENVEIDVEVDVEVNHEEECEENGQDVEVEVEHDVEVDVEECEEDKGNDSYSHSDNEDCEETDNGQDVEVEVEQDVEVEVEQNDDGYYQLDSSECDTDEIKNMIDEAIEYVTGRETEKIPQDDYHVTDIVSVAKKENDDGDYYKCEVKAENDDGSNKLDLKFTSKVDGDSYKVKSYWFHISTKN